MSLYSRYLLAPLIDFTLSRDFILAERRTALAQVQGEVLEIGFGTGLNLAAYPPTVQRLVAFDREPMLRRRVARRMAEAAMPVELTYGDAAQLPWGPARFDSVVSTFTLCSVADVGRVLSEIARVLRPGGRFYFLEHGRSHDDRVARRQDRWNGLHRFLAGGCHLNRPVTQLLEQQGYSFDRHTCYTLPELPAVAGTLYRGIAFCAGGPGK